MNRFAQLAHSLRQLLGIQWCNSSVGNNHHGVARNRLIERGGIVQRVRRDDDGVGAFAQFYGQCGHGISYVKKLLLVQILPDACDELFDNVCHHMGHMPRARGDDNVG